MIINVLFQSLRRNHAWFVFSMLVALSFPVRTIAAGSGSISGRVQDSDTGGFVYNAQITASVLGAKQSGQHGVVALSTTSDQSGSFRLDGLPEGQVILHVVYTGMSTSDLVLSVTAGQETEADVRLVGATGGIVTLDALQVNVSKAVSAQELAINSQRYASNLKSAVSVDDLGFIGDGSVANALKFLPGVDLETDSYGYGNAITMSGAPSANVPVMYGGFGVTTSADSTAAATATAGVNSSIPQRSAQLMTLSLNNISRIEINRSTLPDDPGSALAGSINFVPKSAFEVSKPKYFLSVFGAADQNHLAPGSTISGPWSTNIRSTFPGMVFAAVVPVNKRFGFSATISTNTVPKAYNQQTENWNADYLASSGTYAATPLDPSHYLSNGQTLDSFLSIYQRTSLNLTADYKVSEHGSLAATFTQSYNTLKYGDREVGWGNTGWASLTNSTLTNEVEINTTSLQPRLLNSDINWQVNDANHQFTLDYKYDFDGWKIDFGNSYGAARKQTRDADVGTAEAVAYNLRPLDSLAFNNIGDWGPQSITASQSGVAVTPMDINTFAAAGNFTTSYYDPTTGVQTTVTSVLPAIRFKPIWVGDHRFEAKGSISKSLNLAIPTTVKIGYNFTDYGRVTYLNPNLGTNGFGFLYVGSLPLSAFAQSGYNTPLADGYGTPKVLNNQLIASTLLSNPSQFIQARPWQDYETAVQNDNKITELVSAGYVRIDNSLFGDRLKLAYGIRYELTEDKGLGSEYNPAANEAHNSSGQLLSTTGTVYVPGSGQKVQTLYATDSLAWAHALYQPYADAVSSHYGNYFPSASLSYDITPTVVGRLSYSHTVGRPDLGNIYPSINLPDPSLVPSATTAATLITMNNTGLHPWTSDNIGLSLEYYSPNGLNNVTLRGYRRFVSNSYGTETMSAAQTASLLEQYGADPSEYPGAYIVTKVNMPGTVVTSGLELSGTFSFDKLLPDWGRGLRLIYSAARSTQTGGGNDAINFSAQNLYLVPYSFGSGLAFHRARYSVSLNGKWNSKERLSYQDYTSNAAVDPNTYEYRLAALRVDFDANYYLTRNLSLFINGRDITGYSQILQIYSPTTPDIAKNFQRAIYTPVWTMGLNAQF